MFLKLIISQDKREWTTDSHLVISTFPKLLNQILRKSKKYNSGFLILGWRENRLVVISLNQTDSFIKWLTLLLFEIFLKPLSINKKIGDCFTVRIKNMIFTRKQHFWKEKRPSNSHSPRVVMIPRATKKASRRFCTFSGIHSFTYSGVQKIRVHLGVRRVPQGDLWKN